MTLTQVVDLSRSNRNIQALDLLHIRVESLLLERREFGIVTEILDDACILVSDQTIKTSVFLALLTITRPWKDTLNPSRDNLLGLVKARLRFEFRAEFAAHIDGLT